MKYVVILGDGMADRPESCPNNKTPLMAANKPNMDALARQGEMGLVKNVPDGYPAGSDVANLSVLGFAPAKCYSGRSPLEALSIGVDFNSDDVTYRTNLVTLSDEKNLADRTMVDYSAGEITTAESHELIKAVAEAIEKDDVKLYAGVSYRHCLVLKNSTTGAKLTPPHDISDKKVGDYLPKGEHAELFLEIMEKAAEVLKDHPVNLSREKRGLRPANSVWFWGEGRRPALPDFKGKYAVSGAMISAVDLLKGIAIGSNMKVVEVPGATGNIDTNYEGKAQAALDVLKDHDFVYVHIEAADECGHRGQYPEKTHAIEDVDEKIVKRIKNGLDELGEEYSFLILPDHPTPVSVKTHTREAVPYILFRSTGTALKSGLPYDEQTAKKTGVSYSDGEKLMMHFLAKK